MKRLALTLRGWLWVIGLIVGVFALFLAPWVIRELRPATSESVFQEARAQLGILRHESQFIAAAGELVRGWVDAGDISTATEFVAQLPDSVKPYVQHQFTLALIEEGRLDDALRIAPNLLTTNYNQVYDAPAPTRRDLFVRLASELIDAQRYDDALRVVDWIEQVDGDDTHQLWYFYLAEAAADAGRLDVAEKAMTALRDVYFESSVGAFLLVKGWLNQSRTHKALEWLRNRLKESDSLQAAVDRLSARNVNPSSALLITYYLLEQGQTQQAKEFVNRVTIPPLPIRIRQAVREYLSATSVRSDTVLQAIQELALHEPWLFRQIGYFPQRRVVGATPSSSLNLLKDYCSFSVVRTTLSANRQVYPAILTLLNEGFLNDGATGWVLPRAMLWQDCYDPSLAGWLLNSPDGDRFSFAYGAAAAAQAGRFEDAERLMRKVGGISRDWYDIYRRGYAVGLAKKGEFRAALWEARRIRSDIYRIGSLARIAAEMRRQGL
ncbi:MAG: hypothetical protein KatS3mg016_2349 [Fimbriimonadales bacterium]|nr:MAG: hypothetical protein KatS3mg016_2349 [Fimbriimonadales bacterium]GIV10465.1 MAG: hypothetical protein KatS3mg019_2556 [Fimbriimonadales bacterium]